MFEIATHKVEYVGEMEAVRDRHLGMRNECLLDMERAFGGPGAPATAAGHAGARRRSA